MFIFVYKKNKDMADNISSKKLTNELEEAVKAGEDLLVVMKQNMVVVVDTAKALKEGFKSVDKSSSKGLSEFNELLKQTNKLTKEQEQLVVKITKAEKEKLDNELKLSKLKQQDLKTLKEEETLRQQKLKTVIIERKEQERLAVQDEKNRKAKERLNSAYAKESKRLNTLRKNYKDLVVSEGKVTKESRKLLKEIKKLDKELKDVDASAGQFQRNVGDYPDTLGKALGSVQKFAVGVLALGGALKGVKTGLESTEEGSEDLRKVTGSLSTAWDQTKNTLGTFALDVVSVGKKLIENAKDVNGLSDAVDNVSNGFEKTGKNLETFTERLNKNIDASDEAIEKTINLEKALRPLNERLSELNGIFDIQNAIAGDSTKSFDEIETAANNAAKASLERAGIQQQIAQEELDIINKLIEARDETSNNIALLNQQSEARIKLTETQNAVDVEQLELQKLIAENTRDRFERELDFAIDAFDTIKTVNERIIADERTSLETRRAIFEETTELTEKSFSSQKALFAEFVSDKIDFDTLVLESDEAVIRSTLRRLDLDDIELGRALEVIRERKIAIQDLIEANNELVESEQERLDLQRDVEASDRAIVKRSLDASEDLEDDRVNIQLQGIEERLENVEVGSVEELRLLKEKNDLILEQQNKQLEKEQEARDNAADKESQADADRLERRKKLIETAQTVLEDQLNKASEKRIARIEAEQEANQARIDQITAAIENGNNEAKQSLAEEEKRSAELAAQKEKERKNAIKLEAGLAILKAFGENDGDLGKTIADSTALIAFISSISSFFDGTEDTGTVAKPLDSNGGRLTITHDNERIMDAKNNAKTKGISNDDLADLGAMHKAGTLNGGVTVQQFNNQEMISGIRDITNAVKNIPVSSYNYDANGKYHVQVLKDNHGTQRLRMKAKNPYTSE